MDSNSYSIFKQGSRTYFYSSLFFPSAIRDDVFWLYAFVRVADDYVDSIPQKRTEFHTFRKQFESEWVGKSSGNDVIHHFVTMAKRVGIQKLWVDAFLDSMEHDLTKKIYQTLAETERYIYGSAEVIGLMMATLMQLPTTTFRFAALQGKAMQYLNFTRDIDEDNSLGRQYLPVVEMKKFGLSGLHKAQALAQPNEFIAFVREQLSRYFEWQHEAEQGYRFIPKRLRLSVQTAAEMYSWTARVIYKNPLVIFEKKVRPSVGRIILYYARGIFTV